LSPRARCARKIDESALRGGTVTSSKINIRRKGFVVVYVALLFTVIIGIMALAVDVGYVYNVQGDLQAAADAAALAAASGLSIDDVTTRDRAVKYAMKNYAAGSGVDLQSSDIELGYWDRVTGFTPVDSSGARPNAVRVTARLSEDRGTAVGLFLASVLGVDSINMSASSIAVFGSRDIMLTLDYSGSMNDDSELRHASSLGLGEVEGHLDLIWQDLGHLWRQAGSPLYGTGLTQAKTRITGSNSHVLSTLLLDGVSYPYPSGSWNGYINYVKWDWTLLLTGYRHYYGYRTLVNYWQDEWPMASQTPDLWQTHEQPLTAVKDAVTVFLSYMEQEPTDDRVGLVSYTSEEGWGKVEAPLTDNYGLIESTSRQMQAAHYHRYTNIGGGIEAALGELLTSGREKALQLIVLLSDGKANRPGGTATGRQTALDQAELAANNNIPIVTISLGVDADVDLMGEIAAMTGGIHFVVPGGDDVADYEEQLFAVFAEIAGHLPLKLVH
jgi:Flp pilus assembly protein TadG